MATHLGIPGEHSGSFYEFYEDETWPCAKEKEHRLYAAMGIDCPCKIQDIRPIKHVMFPTSQIEQKHMYGSGTRLI